GPGAATEESDRHRDERVDAGGEVEREAERSDDERGRDVPPAPDRTCDRVIGQRTGCAPPRGRGYQREGVGGQAAGRIAGLVAKLGTEGRRTRRGITGERRHHAKRTLVEERPPAA